MKIRIQEIQLELHILKQKRVIAEKILYEHEVFFKILPFNEHYKTFNYELAIQIYWIKNDIWTQKEIVSRINYQINVLLKELDKIGTAEALLTKILN